MNPIRTVYLYRITNTANNKLYIGQTIDPNSRWRAHRKRSADDGPKQAIHHAIKKYGNDVFEFEVIACAANQEDADWAEEILIQQYQSRYPTGYNIEMGGLRKTGYVMSQITKDKISELAKKRYQEDPIFRAHLQNIRATYHKRLEEQGLPLPIHTPEGKQKSMMAFQDARDGYRQEYGFDWSVGVGQRPEFRKKLSDAMRSKIQSLPQHWSKGRKLSPEHKAAIRRTSPLSPEHRTVFVEGGKDTQFKIGRTPHNKKLTPEIADQMKAKHVQGVSIRALSREYNINTKSISHMLKGKNK